MRLYGYANHQVALVFQFNALEISDLCSWLYLVRRTRGRFGMLTVNAIVAYSLKRWMDQENPESWEDISGKVDAGVAAGVLDHREIVANILSMAGVYIGENFSRDSLLEDSRKFFLSGYDFEVESAHREMSVAVGAMINPGADPVPPVVLRFIDLFDKELQRVKDYTDSLNSYRFSMDGIRPDPLYPIEIPPLK